MLRGEGLRAQKACVSGVEGKRERGLEEKEMEHLPFSYPEKTADILRRQHWFPLEMTSENERRNSILMTRHYLDLGSAAYRLKQFPTRHDRSKVLPTSG